MAYSFALGSSFVGAWALDCCLIQQPPARTSVVVALNVRRIFFLARFPLDLATAVQSSTSSCGRGFHHHRLLIGAHLHAAVNCFVFQVWTSVFQALVGIFLAPATHSPNPSTLLHRARWAIRPSPILPYSLSVSRHHMTFTYEDPHTAYYLCRSRRCCACFGITTPHTFLVFSHDF